MKSNWKNYKGIKYRRIRETDVAIFIEYNGGVGGYEKNKFKSDEDFIMHSEENMSRLIKEISEKNTGDITEVDKSLFDRWQSETGREEY